MELVVVVVVFVGEYVCFFELNGYVFLVLFGVGEYFVGVVE